MDTIYRIYTEDVNRQTIEDLAAQEFTSYTIIEAAGVWRGTKERSVIIEVIGTSSDKAGVYAVAKQIRGYNNQDAVLVTQAPIIAELV